MKNDFIEKKKLLVILQDIYYRLGDTLLLISLYSLHWQLWRIISFESGKSLFLVDRAIIDQRTFVCPNTGDRTRGDCSGETVEVEPLYLFAGVLLIM